MDIKTQEHQFIENLLSDRSKRVFVVVAHPDDVIINLGGISIVYGGPNWKVVLGSSMVNDTFIGERRERRKKQIKHLEFFCETLNFSPLMQLEVAADTYSKVDPIAEISDIMKFNIPNSYYWSLFDYLLITQPSVIITHNKYGEYGNLVHSILNSIVSIYKNIYSDWRKIVRPVEMLTFGTSDVDFLPSVHFKFYLDPVVIKKKNELSSVFEYYDKSIQRKVIVQKGIEGLTREL